MNFPSGEADDFLTVIVICCVMQSVGILEETFNGRRIINLFDSEEDRTRAWNAYSEKGRKRKGFQKVSVEITFE